MLDPKTTDHEKLRIHPRAILTRPVTLEVSIDKIEQAAMIDVSVTGAKIKISTKSDLHLKPKDILNIYWTVVPGTHQLKLKARLKWIDRKTGSLGVEWTELPLISRKIISRLVYFHRS